MLLYRLAPFVVKQPFKVAYERYRTRCLSEMVFLSAGNTDPNDIKWITIMSGVVIFFEGIQ